MSHVDFIKMAMYMSHVSVAYFPLCHMLNLRNSHASGHHVTYHLALCHMSNFKKSPCRHVEFRGLGHSRAIRRMVRAMARCRKPSPTQVGRLSSANSSSMSGGPLSLINRRQGACLQPRNT